jgi:hypothetical protein
MAMLISPSCFFHGQEQIFNGKLGHPHYRPLVAFHSGDGISLHSDCLGEFGL